MRSPQPTSSIEPTLANTLKPTLTRKLQSSTAVQSAPLRALYDAYSFNVIPALGRAVAGDAAPYQYLVESIRQFPDQETLAGMFQDAGLSHVTHENILDGVVAIHSGFKL